MLVSDEEDDEVNVYKKDEDGIIVDEEFHYRNELSPFYSHASYEDGATIGIANTKSKVFRKRRQTVKK